MKNDGQPIRNSRCAKDPPWLSNVFLFSSELWAEQVKKPPCTRSCEVLMKKCPWRIPGKGQEGVCRISCVCHCAFGRFHFLGIPTSLLLVFFTLESVEKLISYIPPLLNSSGVPRWHRKTKLWFFACFCFCTKVLRVPTMSVGRQNLCDWNGRGTAGVRSAQDNPPNSHFASRQHFGIMPLEGGG